MKVLTLRGGRVIDPAQDIDGPFDVTIEDGRIRAVEPARAREAGPNERVEDAPRA